MLWLHVGLWHFAADLASRGRPGISEFQPESCLTKRVSVNVHVVPSGQRVIAERFLLISLKVVQSYCVSEECGDLQGLQRRRPPTHQLICCISSGEKALPREVSETNDPALLLPRSRRQLHAPQLLLAATLVAAIISRKHRTPGTTFLLLQQEDARRAHQAQAVAGASHECTRMVRSCCLRILAKRLNMNADI